MGEISDSSLGKMLDQKKNKGIPQFYLGNKNVRWGCFDLSCLHMMPFEAHEMERYSIQRGDLVICEGGEPGRCAIWEDTESIMYQKALHRVRFISGVNAYYVYYWLYNAGKKGLLDQYCTGSTIKHLPGDKLRTIAIDLPDERIQTRIASILRSMDLRIKNNEAINQNLSEQIETILLKYLDEDGTSPVKLGDYLYIKGRIGWKGLKKDEYLPLSDYRIINGESLTKAGIDWDKAGYISEERYVESPEIMLKPGDILLSKDGTIGKIGYVDSLEKPTSVASGIFVIRNEKPDCISTTFIYYLLKSKLFDAFIAARTEGSVIPHLYQKDFMEFEFPLPNSIRMAEFESVAEPMFSLIVKNLNENKRLAAMRDSILPKLMSGELDVSELDL